MRKLYYWYKNLSRRARKSIVVSASTISGLSVLATILGYSLEDISDLHVFGRLCIIIALFFFFESIAYIIIGFIFKDSIDLRIRGTRVSVQRGNIFDAPAFRVIACDSCFDTRIDDVVIAKNSLHGQLVAQHGDRHAIEELVENEAKRRGIARNQDGRYEFPIGTIIKYESAIDGGVYLMLAMNELDEQHKAYTDMAQYEQMLMQMWEEIDRVYALHDVAIPILGDGITRFRNGPQGKENLLRCMLCTLASSSVTLKSKVSVILYDDADGISLYELKDLLFRS